MPISAACGRSLARFGAPALALPLALLVAAPLAAQQRDSSARADSVARLPGVRVTAASVLRAPLLPASAVSVAPAARVAEGPSRILPDVLRELPGVQVQQTNAGHGTVMLRGLTGNQVLVLVDGVRLNNSTVRDGPNQYLALIDPERIERVEVVRGPGSVLFGSDAIGGVVNVVTRRAAGEGATASLAHATADGGSRLALSGGTALGEGAGARPRLELRAGAAASRVGELRAGGDVGRQAATGYESIAGDVSARAPLGGCGAVSAQLQGMQLDGVSRFDRLVDFRAPAPGPDAEFAFDPQTHLLATAGYEAEGCGGRLGAGGVSVGTQRQREGRRERGLDETGTGALEPAPSRSYLRDDVRTRFARLWLEPRAPGGVAVRVGADAYADDVASHGYDEVVATGERTPIVRASGAGEIPTGRFPNGARATAAGVYAHAAALVAGRLRLLGGARWDDARVRLDAGDSFGGRVRSRNARLTAQLGAELALGGSVVASAHAGQGFRAPNVYDLSTVSSVPGGVVLPSPELRPERSVTYEAALRRTAGRASAAVTGYVTRIDDLVDRLPGSYRGDTLLDGERVFRAANLGRATVAGVELSGSAALGSALAVRAQAFHTRGSQRLQPGGPSEPVSKVPPTSASLALRRTLGTGARAWVEAVGRGAAAQRRLSARDLRDSRIQPGGTPAWATLGVRAGFPAGAARVTAGLENLLDRAYREHGSGIDSPGRHLWVRVEVGSE